MIYLNFTRMKLVFRYFLFLVICFNFIAISLYALENDHPVFLKNGSCECNLCGKENQWQDFKGIWNKEKPFLHLPGKEANLPACHPLFEPDLVLLNTGNWYCQSHFYRPPKNKFMCLTYLPPPLTGLTILHAGK